MLSGGRVACRELIAQCVQAGLLGGGWDRHLFALKALAERKGLPVPAIFEDAVSDCWRLLPLSVCVTARLHYP